MPGIACFPDQSPIDSLPIFAVALTTNGGSHVGVLYWSKDEVWLLHLAGHNSLNVDKAIDVVPDNYGWVIPNLDPMELEQLAGFARIQAKNKDRNPPVSFAFNYLPTEYRYVRGGAVQFFIMHGFTCATYVMSFFDRLKIPLIDHSAWTLRPDDEATQRWLLPHIARRGATQQHLEDARNEIPCLRYRPQEVAGACLSDARPVNMATAEQLARDISDRMTEFYRRVGVI